MQYPQSASSFRTIQNQRPPYRPPANSASEAFTIHGLKPGEIHNHDSVIHDPRLETRNNFSNSSQWTPTTSNQSSPTSAAPHHGSSSWNTHHNSYAQPNGNGLTTSYRQRSFSSQAPTSFFSNGAQSPYYAPQQVPSSCSPTNTRGTPLAVPSTRHSQVSDQRFSAATATPYRQSPTRSRSGHFHNLQWNASDGDATRTEGQNFIDETENERTNIEEVVEDEDNPFRPSKALQVEDQVEKEVRPTNATNMSGEAAKVSFAFKTKRNHQNNTKAPPDLNQRMKEPTRKGSIPERRGEMTDGRVDNSSHRHGEVDALDHLDSEADVPEPTPCNPNIPVEKIVLKRRRAKRALSPSVIDSGSVYFRKPGNESVVGSGTYGKVFKAIHVYTRKLAALKKIRMDGEKDGFPVTAVREIRLLQFLNHENVVLLQEVMVEHNDCFMVFEYLSHDLTGLLNHPNFQLEHSNKKHLALQLFEGLNYLHRRGVLHRDIKAANILVSEQGLLKLADFGLARFYSKRGRPDYTNRVITIWYRSPELLLGETQYGPAVDIWSAACVLIEIFTRHAIFPGDGGEINQLDKIFNILGTPTRSEWPGLAEMAWYELLRPRDKKASSFAERYKDRLTPAAFDLLLCMFNYDPKKRPSASDVLNHPYFLEEEPAPRQAIELKELKGDWHEFESKALRKENERRSQEARRAAKVDDHERDRNRKRPPIQSSGGERDPKKARQSSDLAIVSTTLTT